MNHPTSKEGESDYNAHHGSERRRCQDCATTEYLAVIIHG
jgi:hypothetical protein